ncbi:hypothetical protein FO519_007413 [Halicephalobus sp. NKZ332]|nr:hypothetical protein FO519_007413 [Halicephalobus sp. NKZ332]
MNNGNCEIGSIPLPNVTWLVGAVSVFQGSYGEIHPYLAPFLCVAGTLMNIITVIVLTRPQMISPVNVLLCAVALCDIIVMTSYFVLIAHFFITAANRCDPSDYSEGWAWFTYAHAHVSVIFHATSIWLTVSLAQIRVLTIRRATAGPTKTITVKFTVVLSLITCLMMTAINLPNFLSYEIVEIPAESFLTCLRPVEDDIVGSYDEISNSSASHLESTLSPIVEALLGSNHTEKEEYVEAIIENEDEFMNDSGSATWHVRPLQKDCAKMKMAFWSQGIIFKVAPCILLTFSIVALLKIISDVSDRKKSLCEVMKKKVPKDHTTPMLVAVLSIFLIAELPQGVMLVLTGVFSSQTFHDKFYIPLGDFMDVLSLVNSAVNFLIYCAMSRKFRSVFFQLFFSCCRNKFDGFDDFNQFYERTDISHRKFSSASAITTNYTKTEQLSHYPSSGSAMNLAVLDHVQKRFNNTNLLSVNDAASRRSSSSDYYQRRFSSAVSTFEPEQPEVTAIKSQKRISFNLIDDSPSFHGNMIKIPAKNSIVKSPRLSPWSRFRERFRPISKIGKYIFNNETTLLLDTSSPQRRFNNIQTETNFAGIVF